jgi:hypothetical protein
MYMEIAQKVRRRGIRTETTFSNVTYTDWTIGWVTLRRTYWPRHNLSADPKRPLWVESSIHWTFTVERPSKFPT